MHLFAKNAASEQQQRSPQTLLCGMRLTEVRCSDTFESFVQLRRTRARRCSAGSSATISTRERCARDNFQPFLPLTNTLRMPALLCDRYLSYEWLVSHRFCADNDDYDRAHNCSRMTDAHYTLPGRIGGGRCWPGPVHWVWGCVARLADAPQKCCMSRAFWLDRVPLVLSVAVSVDVCGTLAFGVDDVPPQRMLDLHPVCMYI